ncbi:MAG: CRTAC1 family protein [Pirellulales bacterium]
MNSIRGFRLTCGIITQVRRICVGVALILAFLAGGDVIVHPSSAQQTAPQNSKSSVQIPASQKSSAQSTQIRLTDVSSESGIDFIHTDGGTGKRFIVESVVAGLASCDFDNDGMVDVFFVNGVSLQDDGSINSSGARGNALYRNIGQFKFRDVAATAGVDQLGYGMGAVCADYDEDGFVDLYVSNFGQNFLYHNNGDGTFEDRTKLANLVLPNKVGAGCSFLDLDNDGDLDLYVGSYVQFSIDKHVNRFIGKHQFHPGPVDYPASPDVLFRNEGDGTFVDISIASGISKVASYSMGVVAFDADEDGDTDIFVGNDQRPNTLWINDGSGVFEDQAFISGVALDRHGKANGNMGVEIGDVNGDGLVDLFTTTYQDEMPVLYMNLGGGLFMDQTNVVQIDNRLHPHVTWGCGMVDFDNDGDLDIYVACGHFMDNIGFIDDRTTVKVRDFVLENRGGKFIDVSRSVGSGLDIVESSRGAAFDDFDNDGDVDVIVLNWNSKPSVLRNDCQNQKRGLSIQLVGTQGNRSAIGAKVFLHSDQNSPRASQVVAGRGYQSHYGSTLHFGITPGDDCWVEVVWPGSSKERGEKFSNNPDAERSWTELFIQNRKQ